MMTREGEKNGFSVESRGKSAPRNPCTGRKLIFFTMNRNSDVWQACVGEIRVRRRRLECEIVGLLVRNPEERFYFSYLSSFPRIYIYIYYTTSQHCFKFLYTFFTKYICQRNEKSITNNVLYKNLQ